MWIELQTIIYLFIVALYTFIANYVITFLAL